MNKHAQVLMGIAATLLGCQGTGPDGLSIRESTLGVASCLPETYGAIADDGLDDRAALQAALNGGCLQLGTGIYAANTPPGFTGHAVLTLPSGASVTGMGANRSVIEFGGVPGDRDWFGIQLSSNTAVSGISLNVAFTGPTQNEQTHVISGRGPLTGVTIGPDVTIRHPVVAGSSMGDCIQLVGYPPLPDGSGDKRIWNVDIGHVTFEACARSGIAMHSGVHATQIHDNRFMVISDQAIDEEGTGDNGGTTASDVIDVHDNVFDGTFLQSTLEVSVYPGLIHFHHNRLRRRGLDVLGCSTTPNAPCEFDHNVITQMVPNDGAPVVYFRKAGASIVHDESYLRAVSAGPGVVVSIAQKITAPGPISIADSILAQQTNVSVLSVFGAKLVTVARTTLSNEGTVATQYGIDSLGGTGVDGIRANVVVTDSTFIGPMKAALRVTGSKAGTETAEFQRNSATATPFGIACENVLATATNGGITGPIVYRNNGTLPFHPSCLTLIQVEAAAGTTPMSSTAP